MIGVSGLMGNSGGGDGADAHESGGASGGSSEIGAASSTVPSGAVEDSGGGGGNRWPRQETLALLKIRSEMDAVFRESSLKGPLWEEVSRKMAELGFQRSAKKCKEKFENVYKYHKRTKDGRSSKPDGKAYRFFDQLQALENAPPQPFPHPPPPMAAPPMPTILPHSTVPSSISPNPVSMVLPTMPPPPPAVNISNPLQLLQPSHHPPANLFSNTTSSSSSTSSDEDIQRPSRRGRKRKWKIFFRRLMKEVIQKQEELQKKFLESLAKRERDRTAREEAWRTQERARLNREHELLVQERSMAAAKDAAVIAFLQKVTDQHINLQIPTNLPIPLQPPEIPQPRQQPPSNQATPPLPPPAPPMSAQDRSQVDKIGDNNNSISTITASRWPKAEVQALINLRTSLDLKYQETGPKGPLWEEISMAMAKLGYNRSSKRCKEKWENINKYFKKVKESNKKRSEDSKTCPYFHQLDAIYRERAKSGLPSFNSMESDNPPIMARPEQQWPLPEQPQPQPQPPPDSAVPDQAQGDDTDNDEDDDDGDDDDDGGDEEEDEGGDQGFEIVANKQPVNAAE